MKRILGIFLVFVSIITFGIDSSTKSNEIYLKIKENTDIDLEAYFFKKIKNPNPSKDSDIQSIFKIFDNYQVTESKKAFKINSPTFNRTYRITFRDSTQIDLFLTALNNNKWIEYAEKIPIYKSFYTPNDLHPNQWYLSKINATQAWDLSVGSQKVVIAVVDDAVRLDHQDIAPNLWVNPNEIAGNSIDDDGNGYVDDINGYDVADNDNNPSTTDEEKTHGTHCAGIAGAKSNNGFGIASISSNCKIMAVKCTSDSDFGPTLPYADVGLAYAINAKPNVISLSWGSYSYSQTIQNLINNAYNAGIIVVAAAGNDNSSILMYPASYNNVISVGATNSSDIKASFSNFGSKIDVMAPGQNIWSSMSSSTSDFDYLSGTSMACPLVAGLCGLMKATEQNASNVLIEACLKSSATNIDVINPGFSNKLGSGRIDALKALQCISGKPLVDFITTTTSACVGQPITFLDKSFGQNITNYSWTFIGANITTSTLKNPVIIYSNPGTYSVILAVTNLKGNSTLVKTNYINIKRPLARISGTETIVRGQQTPLIINFNGNPPYSFTLSDGTTNTPISNIFSNPHFRFVAPNSTRNYTISNFSDASCVGSATGIAMITVSTVASPPPPITTPGNNCVSSDGLVAYYPFDGNANDMSGNGNNSPFFNSSFNSIGRLGLPNTALSFTGSNLLAINNTLGNFGTGDFAFSFWFNSKDVNKVNRFFAKRQNDDFDNYFSVQVSNGKLYIETSENIFRYYVIESSSIIQNNTWYHVVAQRKNNELFIYLNSNLANSNLINGSKQSININNNFDFLIGNARLTNGSPFNQGLFGGIEDIRIYNRALSDCEIKKLYDCNSTCSEPVSCAATNGLVAYYPFDGNANDASGNGRHGTLPSGNSISYEAGKELQSVRFNNSNHITAFDKKDYITLPNLSTNDLTFSFWHLFTSTAGQSFGSCPIYQIGIESNIGLSLGIRKNNISNKLDVLITNFYNVGNPLNQFYELSLGYIPDNTKWVHITVTKSQNTISGFINGIKKASIELNRNLSFTNEINHIAYQEWYGGSSSTSRLNGNVDEFRLYDRALSDCEIKKLYDCNTVCSPPITNCASSNGLVAFYPFDGNANDASGNGNNGTTNTAILTSDRFGILNSAYDFNGIDSKIYTTNNVNVTTAISISAWIYVRNLNNIFTIVSEDNPSRGPYSFSVNLLNNQFDYRFGFANNGSWSDYISHTKNLDYNRWIHTVITAGNGNLSIYLDGVKVETKTTVGLNMIMNSDYIKIGYERYIDSYSDGKIDDLRIYNRVLSDCEIKKLYDCNSTCSSGLVAHYPFCGNANDVSGNNNNGSVSGATLTTDRFGNENSAYSFNGLNSKITILDSPIFKFKQITINAWVAPENNNAMSIIGKSRYSNAQNEQFQLYINWQSAGTLGIAVKPNPCNIPGVWERGSGIATFSTNNWQMITGVYDGFTLKTYFNGTLVSNTITTLRELQYCASGDITIGSWWNNSFNFKGKIDDLSIYDRGLTQAEITALYNEPAPCTTPSGLVAHYPFCGNANDVSGNNYNGSVLGATLTTDRFGNENSAYSFDGVSKYITIPKQKIKSISFWFDVTDLQITDNPVLMANYDNINSIPVPNTNLMFGFQYFITGNVFLNPGYISGHGLYFWGGWKDIFIPHPTLSTGWHHVSLSINNNQIYFMIDGNFYDGYKFENSTWTNKISQPFVFNDSFNNFSLSKFILGGLIDNSYFKGKIDDLKFFDYSLTTSQMIALYNEPAPCTTPSGLVAHYPFCGNANDVSGNNYNGSVLGATLTTDRFGNENSAYSFDGIGGLVKVSKNYFNYSDFNPFSISVWIYPTENTSKWILLKNGTFGIKWNGINSPIEVYNGNNPYLSTNNSNWQLNTWYNLILTDNGNGIFTCFLNGTFDKSESNSPGRVPNYIFEVGGTTDSFLNSFFKGKLDDIKIFNKALTQAEITALFNEPAYCPTKTCPPLSISGTSSFCKSAANNIRTYSVNPIAGGSYFWFLSGNYIGSGSRINVNLQEIGNYTITAIASDTCQKTASKVISVNCCSAPSNVEANFDVSNTICGNKLFNITNNSTGNKFDWYFGDFAVPKTFSGYNPPQVFYQNSSLEFIKLVVSNNCGLVDSFSREILILQTPVAIAGNDISICGMNDNFVGTTNIWEYNYKWTPENAVENPFIANPKLTKNYVGKIYLQVSSLNSPNCIAIDSLNVIKLDSTFTTNLPKIINSICEDVVLNPQSSLISNRYLWNTGSTLPGIKAVNSGLYFVKTYNKCEEKLDSVQVNIQRPIEKIPNIITPNGDTFNDFLEFFGCYYEQTPFSIQIFSRYGIKVYQSDNYKNNWNGEGLPDGIYYYSTENLKTKEIKKSWIQILR